MNFNDRVVQRINKLGLTPTGLARILNTRQSTIDQLVKGRTKTFRRMPELAVALQTNVEWLLTGQTKEETPLTVAEPSARTTVQFGPDTVPILGHANGSQDAVVLNMDNEIGRAVRHPNQQGLKNCFALYARGESMSPRYMQGELIYVVGDKPVNKGQDCVVEMNNGEGFVKQFIRMTTKEVICSQLNPIKEWKKLLSEVKAIHAIVGRG